MKKGVHVIYKCGYCGYVLLDARSYDLLSIKLYSNAELLKSLNYECPNCHKKFVGVKKIEVSYETQS